MNTFFTRGLRALLLLILILPASRSFAQSKSAGRSATLSESLTKSFGTIEDLAVSEATDVPLFVRGELAKNIRLNRLSDAKAVLKSAQDVYRLKEGKDDFDQLSLREDDLGMTHLKLQQTYNGVRIFGAEIIMHTDKSLTLREINGRVLPGLSMDVIPTVTAERAVQAAMVENTGAEFRWLNQAAEQSLKEVFNDNARTWTPTPELVISPAQGDFEKGEYRLAWKFTLAINAPTPANYEYFVDAKSGAVINKFNSIHTADAGGTGTSNYNGTVSFRTNSGVSGGFEAYDIGRNIKTYNLNGGTSLPGPIATDTDNSWTTTTQKSIVDAHWGASNVYDYYKNIHNRTSFNNAGAQIRSSVHYSNGYNNAFWNGSQMVYGDGDGTTFTSLTSLDVCGHELTHAVTEYEAGLVYQGESGAINEANSDIFGAAIEFYVRGGSANWLIGEECYTPNTSGDALRSMSNPNSENQPDTYQGSQWASTAPPYTQNNDYGGVHINSGVLNYAFYLLSVGGSGTNDNSASFSVTGISLDKARLIAYRALANYLTSSSNFAACRTAYLSATADLYGTAGTEYAQVQNAFAAVGIGSPAGGGTPPPTVTEVEPNNSTSAPQVLTAPGSITGLVSTSTDNDYFAVTVGAGATLTLGLTVPSGKDYDLFLVNSAGTTLKKSENGTSASESMTYANTGSGDATYFVRVFGYNGAFSTAATYGLTFSGNKAPGSGGGGNGNFTESEPNESRGAANAISVFPATITGKIGSSTDNDYFSASVDAGKLLSLGLTVPSGKDYDLFVYNSSGTIVARSEAGAGAPESINYTAPSSGTYYVRVFGYSGAFSTTANYTLTASKPNGITAEFAGFSKGTQPVNEFKLAQNYPNPFNPQTTIQYALKEDGAVSLKVYDMTGRVVADLVNERQVAGIYNVKFNASQLSSGTYFYRLSVVGSSSSQAGNFVQNKRMTLVK
ncbi:MAG: M4 family metallopeptidase [Rhizobacter sp.]|nr:M4 family metallopeptidase [Chlorobiales bacterium]